MQKQIYVSAVYEIHSLQRVVNMDTFDVKLTSLVCGDITVVTIVENVCNNVLAIIAT